VRARAPGALILFLLRSSPSRDVNDLQLDISRRSPPVLLPCRSLPRGRQSRKRSAILAGNPRGYCSSFLLPSLSLSSSAVISASRGRPRRAARFGRSCDSAILRPHVDALDTTDKWIEVHYQPGRVFPSRLGEIRNNGQLSVDSGRDGRGKRNNVGIIIARNMRTRVDNVDKYNKKIKMRKI